MGMQYQLKIVFVDNQELILDTTQKHGFSDDLELFEVTTSEEIFVIPLKQIKYISCDAKIFQNSPNNMDPVTGKFFRNGRGLFSSSCSH